MLEEMTFEKVCEWIWLQLEPLWTFPLDPQFHQGYRVGVVLTLCAVIILSVLWRIRRFCRRRCREVVLPSDNGMLTITAAAITDAVEMALADIGGLAITRCRIYRSRTKLRLEIRCRWEKAEGGAAIQVEEARRQVAEMLDSMFGIKGVKRIDFRITEIACGSGQPAVVTPAEMPMTPPNL